MDYDSQDQSQHPGGSPAFPPTHWSLVVAAGRLEGSRGAEALESLCRAYWYPLYAFARRSRHSPADAQDLTQGFFEHLLESGLVGKADAGKGKFRSFLLASFRNYMSVQRAREGAAKRGGGRLPVEFDEEDAEARFEQCAARGVPPETLFELNWALAVVGRAMALLRAEFDSPSRRLVFERLQPFLEGDRGVVTYAEVARHLGTTEGTIKVTVNRMRRRYRDLLHQVVAETVTEAPEIEEELRHLVQVLNGRW